MPKSLFRMDGVKGFYVVPSLRAGQDFNTLDELIAALELAKIKGIAGDSKVVVWGNVQDDGQGFIELEENDR